MKSSVCLLVVIAFSVLVVEARKRKGGKSKAQIAALSNDVVELKKILNTHKEELNTQKTDLGAQKEQLDGLEKKLGGLEATLDDTLDTLKEELNTQKTDIAACCAQKTQLAELKEKLGGLEEEQSTQKEKLETQEKIIAKLSTYHVPVTTTWSLGMNLNPSDGHIMGYLTGWAVGESIGSDDEALTKDYLNDKVWKEPANYIAIARHQSGVVDAIKVFRFKEGGRSLLSRFLDMNPGRQIVTAGGPIQESIAVDAKNMDDDPIFSVGGDLAFNWAYSNNGARIVLTGGYLSEPKVNDDRTHGLGMDYQCNPLTGTTTNAWVHEIANIQKDSSYPLRPVQGTDHAPTLVDGPVYGNYAIYVSKEANAFPGPGAELGLKM